MLNLKLRVNLIFNLNISFDIFKIDLQKPIFIISIKFFVIDGHGR